MSNRAAARLDRALHDTLANGERENISRPWINRHPVQKECWKAVVEGAPRLSGVNASKQTFPYSLKIDNVGAMWIDRENARFMPRLIRQQLPGRSAVIAPLQVVEALAGCQAVNRRSRDRN